VIELPRYPSILRYPGLPSTGIGVSRTAPPRDSVLHNSLILATSCNISARDNAQVVFELVSAPRAHIGLNLPSSGAAPVGDNHAAPPRLIISCMGLDLMRSAYSVVSMHVLIVFAISHTWSSWVVFVNLVIMGTCGI
jgi:hypothetical protein